MGSKNTKSRKGRNSLPKVPKYEEPNTIGSSVLGGGGTGAGGRYGHGSDHHADGKPGKFGQKFLHMLGLGPNKKS